MTISVGEKFPEAIFLKREDGNVSSVLLGDKLKGRKVVIFGLPGAFTDTCSSIHLPSFMRTRERFVAKGVDEIICVSVNDPWVMEAWDAATGAGKAGVTLLADADASFTKAIGMVFSAGVVGLWDRSMRYAIYAEDGVVKVLNTEEKPGVCELSVGEALLKKI
ncbi:MAG: peroxiredoxin [Rhodobacteraceae bacterium]|nr:peroxiredoxin [Paracoccaceae bacterium]